MFYETRKVCLRFPRFFDTFGWCDARSELLCRLWAIPAACVCERMPRAGVRVLKVLKR